MKLISLLPLNLREAEDEKEAPADDSKSGDENPFAAADDEGSNSEEGGEEGGDKEADKEDQEGEEGEGSTDGAKSLEVVFDANKVRKYNDVKFNVNKGTVTNVSKYGLSIKLPDEQTILVNFDDIL